MSTSRELVPLDYDRQAWNHIHGTNLETHTSILTKEQAERINAQYDVILFVGNHGLAGKYARDSFDLPTQNEYNQVGHVVHDMQPGGALFVEDSGFKRQKSSPEEFAPTEQTLIEPVGFTKRMLGKIGIGLKQPTIDSRWQELSEARRNYEFDAWGYAERQAQIRGIPVISADIDAFLEDALLQGRDFYGLYGSEDNADTELVKRIDSLRVKAACNIVKDWALAHYEDDAEPQQEHKPQLVLLFGRKHTEELEQTFANSGIHTRTIRMIESTPMARAFEQRMRPSVPRDSRPYIL